MGNGRSGCAPAADSGADTPGTGAMARRLTPGSGLERLGHRQSSAPGPSYHRTMAGRLQPGRPGGSDLRAVWRFPPALEAVQQAELRRQCWNHPPRQASGWPTGIPTRRHDHPVRTRHGGAGVQLIFALSPQAKGRVERTAGTFQDRLITELRLAGATTMDEAKAVLKQFLPRFNRRFGFRPDGLCPHSAHRNRS